MTGALFIISYDNNYLGCQGAECEVIDPALVAFMHPIRLPASWCYRDILLWFLCCDPANIGSYQISIVSLALAEGY